MLSVLNSIIRTLRILGKKFESLGLINESEICIYMIDELSDAIADEYGSLENN